MRVLFWYLIPRAKYLGEWMKDSTLDNLVELSLMGQRPVIYHREAPQKI